MSNFDDQTRVPVPASGIAEGEAFMAGHIVGGKFKIISLVGTGGMGSVYRVEQIFLKQELALKVLDKRLVKSEVQMRRFQLEAVAAASLSHPNLVKVHDFGFLENQQPYLLMDFIRGITLAELLEKEGRLSFERARPIFVQSCEGLAFAHAKSIVHRDIKPGNIMIVPGNGPETVGGVKIVDFGIAKIASHEAGEVQALTRTGEIFGSPLYMSPEQCSGAPVDHRADIYSLGCALFEALTGTPPFVGTNALRTMMLHQTGTIPSLGEASLGIKFPPGVEALLHCMLNKEPHERYQSMLEVADVLRNVGTSEADIGKTPARMTTKKAEKKGSVDTSIVLLVIAAATVLLTGVASFFIYQLLQSDRDKARREQEPRSSHQVTLDDDTIGAAMDRLKTKEDKSTDRLKSVLDQMAPVKPVYSGVGADRMVGMTFPSEALGAIKSLRPHVEVDDFAQYFETPARGDIRVKADAPLIFILGNKYPGGFDNPQLMQKIDPNIFSGLELCSPERNFTGKENSRAESEKSAAALSIAQHWPNLKYLEMHTMYIDYACSDAIDKCKNLEWIVIHDPLGAERMFAHANWLQRIKTLSLADCSADDILPGVAGSTALERIGLENSATPDSFAFLQKCPNLKFLQLKAPVDQDANYLKISDKQIAQIANLKQLKVLFLKYVTVTPRQIEELRKNCPQLKLGVMDRDRDDKAHIRYFNADAADFQGQ
jgi:serine/threonine protein kinase